MAETETPVEAGSNESEIESKPLSTLEAFKNWQSPSHQVKSCVYALAKHSSSPEKKGKTLLCHDMKGGYLEDRFIHGSENADAYRFFHWSLIDTFVYFSHALVTIPPVTWINAAHRNGVKILGTFITEGWVDGNEICNQMFSTADDARFYAKQLFAIAKHYEFDGWLINIENQIDPTHISHLITFIRYLTNLMHDEITGGLVIWYDSVVSPEGKLLWQNELNELNECFFDACDGIFLNYTWNGDNLSRSYTRAKASNRNFDVFVGIDVFGRNCFGGGGMNTNLALAEIKKFDLSVAIFAPGWTHEVLGCENFTCNEHEFWSKLCLSVSHRPSQLPITTSFCQGFGKKFYKSGEVREEKSWHNLSLQQLQPCSNSTMRIHTDDAYSGGGCLKACERKTPLLLCDCPIQKGGCILYALTFKSVDADAIIYSILSFLNADDASTATVKLNDYEIASSNSNVQIININEPSTKDDRLKSLLQQNNISFTNNGWNTHCFLLRAHNSITLEAINIEISDKMKTEDNDNEPLKGTILIGQLKIIECHEFYN